jgi:enamine deaminase RidA (YjgF/YER057c/UK114 family)
MSQELNRREVLKKFARGSVAIGASGAIQSIVPVWAQGASPRAGTQRINFARAPLTNGFIVNAGATAMELYHVHPHIKGEELVQPDDIRLQTRLVMRNHKEILDWLGLGWRNVVKLTRYQKRMSESKQIDDVLASYFKDWRPAMTVVEIDGLSSPQARLEIDMWVVPNATNAGAALAQPGTGIVKGIEEIFPRPEVTDRRAYALAARVSSDMDLIFFSGMTAYPSEVDPWNPGSFTLPIDAGTQGKMATDNLDRVLNAAGITPQHILLSATYTAEAGAGISFGERSGNWHSPGTALQVVNTGVPGAKALRQLTAAAPRKARMTGGPIPGIEPILARPDVALKNLPAAPAIRVGSNMDLVFFSAISAYPPEVDPWNAGTFTLPQDVDAQEKVVTDSLDKMLKAAGITWKHIVLIARTGEASSGRELREQLGDWRPCRVTRVISTGVPGAKVMYELTAVAPRRA